MKYRKKHRKNSRTTIHGTVAVRAWEDSEDRPQVAVFDNHGQEFLVRQTGKGRDFLNLIGALVIVVGIASVDTYGNEELLVEDYTKIVNDVRPWK